MAENSVPKEPYKAATKIPSDSTQHPQLPLGARRNATVYNAKEDDNSSPKVHHSKTLIPYMVDSKIKVFAQHPGRSPQMSHTRRRTNSELEESINAASSAMAAPVSPIPSPKPLAMVIPQPPPGCRDEGIQTDSLSIDLDSVIHIQDFRRSQRTEGIWGNRCCECGGRLERARTMGSIEEELVRVKERNVELEAALKTQKKVNGDLKKLLVASVGDDLSDKFEQLSTNCSHFSTELAEVKRKNDDLYEQLDKVSIEADMWKSKFIAGRVMLDELAGWKAQLSVRYAEAIAAVQSLLQERHQIRGDLAETHTQLEASLATPLLRLDSTQQCAVGRLSGTITNSIELSIANRQLSKELHHRLDDISGSSGGAVSATKLPESAAKSGLERCKEYTHGEKAAIEALGNQPNLSADKTGRYFSAYNSPNSKAFENVTLDTCNKCKGEVSVL